MPSFMLLPDDEVRQIDHWVCDDGWRCVARWSENLMHGLRRRTLRKPSTRQIHLLNYRLNLIQNGRRTLGTNIERFGNDSET